MNSSKQLDNYSLSVSSQFGSIKYLNGHGMHPSQQSQPSFNKYWGKSFSLRALLLEVILMFLFSFFYFIIISNEKKHKLKINIYKIVIIFNCILIGWPIVDGFSLFGYIFGGGPCEYLCFNDYQHNIFEF